MEDNGADNMPDQALQVVKPHDPGVPKASGTRFHDMLSASDQEALSAIGTVETFPTAELPIFSEGEKAHSLYSVEEGMVRICRHLENGDRQILAFLWPGDIFGLVDDGHYVNSATTLSAARLHRFPLAKLESLLLRNPQLQLHLLVKVNHDLRAAQRQIIVLGQHDIYHRLASFLVEMQQHVAFSQPDSRQLRLPMTQMDIADYLGTTAETVSRLFQRMEREGIIRRVSPRVLEIEDFSRLARLARR